MRIVISLLLSVALFGCGQTQPSQPELEAALEARLIDTEPVDYFNAASVVATETVQAWAFPESVATWTIDGASAVETTDRGWSIRSTSDHPSTISLETTMAPASIDLVSVEASGIGRGTLRLSWAGAGESFDEQRQVEVGIGTVVRGEIRRYHLKLPIRDQPSITRLRLDLALERNAKVMLESIVAGRRVVDESKLAMTIGQAWKVPLGDDMRNAWVTLPGLVRESTVAVPEDGARLYVGYGRQPDIEVPTTFRIFASSAQTSEDEPLFESTLDKTGEGRWHRAVIDLSAYAGSELTLRFETDSPTMLDPRVGFLAWAHPELRKAGVVGKANLLLVSIDTLRAENLSVYGYERPTSPNLERWAAEHATVFETTVASAPWTLPAHVSMFSGLDAHHHGVNHGSPAPNDLIMLAEVLRASGWTTAAITGGGYVHPQWGFAQGFDSYRSFGEKMGFADELDHNLEQALAWLDEHQDQRFFLFFHTYEVHNPYRAREPYFSELSDLDPKGWFLRTNRERLGADQGYLDTRSWTLLRRGKVHGDGSLPPELESLPYDLYDSGIAYTDAAMGRLLGHLDALGVADQTVVVVTADHGEMLGEHGLVNHLYLYDENLLVPLMIADPTGRGAGGRVSTQVSSVDIVPTVLDLLDLDAPAGLDGRSLAPALDGDPLEGSDEAWSYAAASNYGISLRIRDQIKYVLKNSPWAQAPEPEILRDLRDDPGEMVNLATEPSDRLDAMRRRVAEEVATTVPGLHLTLENTGSQAARLAIEGAAVTPYRLKTPSADDPKVELDRPRFGRMTLEAGEAGRLWLEDITEETVDIELGAERVQIDPTALDQEGQTWALDGSVTITARWQGLRRDAAPSLEQNEELREQLRALGYID